MEWISEHTEARGKMKAIFSHSEHLRLLVIGNVGSGKSSLINTFLNKEVAVAKAGLGSVTHDVEPFKGLATFKDKIYGIRITLWDSPGFQEPFMTPGKKRALIREIQTECREVDLMVYCVKMNQTRFSKGEEETISDLTKALGKNKWKKAIFALTFANALTIPASEPDTTSLDEFFSRNYKDWTNRLNQSLAAAGYDGTVPVIPVGYKIESPLPIASPSSKNWFVDFWIASCERLSWSKFASFARIRGIDVISLDEHISLASTLKKTLFNSIEEHGDIESAWRDLIAYIDTNYSGESSAILEILIREKLRRENV